MSVLTSSSNADLPARALPISYWIRNFTLASGSRVQLDEPGVVVIVGPNNSGKSVLLNALMYRARNVMTGFEVLQGAEFGRTGTASEFEQWLKRVAIETEEQGVPYIRGMHANMPKRDAIQAWDKGDVSRVSHMAITHINASERLDLVKPVSRIGVLDNPVSPQHLLFLDDAVERRLASYVRRAFGVDLVLDRGQGGQFVLRSGIKPALELDEHVGSPSYLRRIARLKPLNDEGDGIKGFVGCLLHCSLSDHLIAAVDEPEAFLHPPQARLLGNLLVKEKPKGQQLIIATHSGDILRGVLDAASDNVTIVRMTRNGGNNHCSVLEASDLRALWDDPLLRFTSILDAVFHERVVVCEGDADCRFYSAVLEALDGGAGDRYPDIMFCACSGKYKIPQVVKALTALSLRCHAIADIDVLREERPLKDIVEALRGDWSAVQPTWSALKKAVEQRKPEGLQRGDVRAAVLEVLDARADPVLTGPEITRMRQALKHESVWDELKVSGTHGISSGQPTHLASKCFQLLRQMNLLVVNVGILERFAPSIPLHGPEWVAGALTKDLRNDPELQAARNFVGHLIGHADGTQ